MADPPWHYNDRINAKTRGAVNHYEVMELEDIKALPVRDVSDPRGAHLYLWAPNSFVREAFEVISAWGFDYKQMITWVKITKAGNPAMGMGHYYRNATEQCLFATTHNFRTIRRDTLNLVFAPREGHSVKPQAMFDVAESMSPPSRLEMFARKPHVGWEGWGNEYTGVED